MKSLLIAILLLFVSNLGYSQTLGELFETDSIHSQSDDIVNRKGYRTVGLTYYGFKDSNNYGLFYQSHGTKAWGGVLALRSNFKKYRNYNFDMEFYYTIPILKNDKFDWNISLGAGISERLYKTIEIDKNMNTKEKYKTTLDVIVLDSRMNFCYNQFVFSLGHFLSAVDCQFEKGTYEKGLFLGVGYRY